MADDRVAPVASPFTVLAAEAAETGEYGTQRPSLSESLVRFCITGFGSLGTDFGLLALLHSVAHAPLAVATAVGVIGAVVVNYTLNRNWSFQAKASHGHTATRYALMVGVNFTSTELIVLALSHAGLNYLISKLVSVAVNAGINFTTARYWVFKH